MSFQLEIHKDDDASYPKLALSPCRCTSQFCDRCALPHAIKWRERLRPALKKWQAVSMLTLTLDPSKFDGPEQAFREVGKKRWVAECIRKLNRKNLLKSTSWVYALEFHKSGWPHWHVLVETPFIDKHKLQAAWARGNCWVSRSRGFKNSNHAVHYVTKYAIKSDAGFPEWVLNYKGKLRRLSTSRGLCPAEPRPAPKYASKPRSKQIVRTPGQRRNSCLKTCRLVSVSDDGTRTHVSDVDVEWNEKFSDLDDQEIVLLLVEEKQREALQRASVAEAYEMEREALLMRAGRTDRLDILDMLPQRRNIHRKSLRTVNQNHLCKSKGPTEFDLISDDGVPCQFSDRSE